MTWKLIIYRILSSPIQWIFAVFSRGPCMQLKSRDSDDDF